MDQSAVEGVKQQILSFQDWDTDRKARAISCLNAENLYKFTNLPDDVLKLVLAAEQKDDLRTDREKPFGYLQRIRTLASPLVFAKLWPAWQLPQGTIGGILDYQKQGPMFNIYRPQSAQGLPAAFAVKAFGTFLDSKHTAFGNTAASETVLSFVDILSTSYGNKSTKTALVELKKCFGEDFVGVSGGFELRMMELVRRELLRFFSRVLSEENKPMTMEPSQVSQGGTAQTDGTIKLKLEDGTVTEITVFIIKGKEDWGEGGGGNPAMQLAAYYALNLGDNWDTGAVVDSFYPAIGLEVFGHGFRVHALFFTDKVCCEPLTEWVHFADLRAAQPSYMAYLVRIVHSLGVLLDDICTQMKPLAVAKPISHAMRSKQLNDGIPWMLQDPRLDITPIVKNKHVYLCKPAEAAATDKAFVAKVAATPYPWELHRELSEMGLAPRLTAPLEECPGGVQVVRMEFLSPADGWMPLRTFSGNWAPVEELAERALHALQSCADGCAVHGDLHKDNVFVRTSLADPSQAEELCFVDLSWGGEEGTARYPPFVNHEAVCAIKDPDCQPILQWHDAKQLHESIAQCRSHSQPHPPRAMSVMRPSCLCALPARRQAGVPFAARMANVAMLN